MKNFEEIYVSSAEVTCDGGSVATGHPKVYLHIDGAKGEITCPYCSKKYILHAEAGKKAAGH